MNVQMYMCTHIMFVTLHFYIFEHLYCLQFINNINKLNKLNINKLNMENIIHEALHTSLIIILGQSSVNDITGLRCNHL